MQCLPILPDEIINNILEINGGLIHRENMISNHENIPLKAAYTKLNNIFSGYKDNGIYNNGNFADYIDSVISYNEKEHLMKLLSKCNCCGRHKIGKPTLKQFYNGTYISTNENTTYIRMNDICKCSCRHMMRWICRTTSNFILDNDNDEIFNEEINQQLD